MAAIQNSQLYTDPRRQYRQDAIYKTKQKGSPDFDTLRNQVRSKPARPAVLEALELKRRNQETRKREL